jgi:hypothetical protein
MLSSDLFSVTQTLQRLLRFNIERLRGPVPALNITAMPPESVTGADTVNLHLFHVVEESSTRNRPGPAADAPTDTTPLGLNLYYILTAHHEVNQVFDAETQHRLMGLAMKTMHDFPRIDDSIAFDRGGLVPEPVLPAGLVGTSARLDIIQRPITPEDAINFWSAESSATVRLATYYEVRTLFLEPEMPQTVSGIVFDVGLFVDAGSPPVLTNSSSQVQFTPPAPTGLGPQTVAADPARATFAPDLVPSPAEIQLTGSAMGSQPDTRIVLRNMLWSGLDPVVDSAEIDTDLNPDWAATIIGQTARFNFRPILRIGSPGGVRQIPVQPGNYQISLRRRQQMPGPGGTQRNTDTESNRLNVALGAHIDIVTPPNIAGRMVLQLTPQFTIDDPLHEYGLSIGGAVYDQTSAFAGDPVTDAGLFMPLPTGLEFHPLFDTATPGFHHVRLEVNGAESQPFWVET